MNQNEGGKMHYHRPPDFQNSSVYDAKRLGQEEIAALFSSLGKVRFVSLDFETTGLSPANNRIIEIGAHAFRMELADTGWQARPEASFESLVNPACSIDPKISALNGIDELTVSSAPYFSELAPSFLDFIKESILIAHNAAFDLAFLNAELGRAKMALCTNPVYDSIVIAKTAISGLPSYSLKALAQSFGIKQQAAHRGADDARVAKDIFVHAINLLYLGRQ